MVVGTLLLGQKLVWVTGLGVLAVAVWRAPRGWMRWTDGRKGVHGTAKFSGGKDAAAAGHLAPEGKEFYAFALERGRHRGILQCMIKDVIMH